MTETATGVRLTACDVALSAEYGVRCDWCPAHAAYLVARGDSTIHNGAYCYAHVAEAIREYSRERNN